MSMSMNEDGGLLFLVKCTFPISVALFARVVYSDGEQAEWLNAMAGCGVDEETTLLANAFTVKNKSNRVILTPHWFVWDLEDSSDEFSVCERSVPISEVIAVRPIEASRSSCFAFFNSSEQQYRAQEILPFHITAFQLHFVERGWKHRWKLRTVTFHNSSSVVIQHWISTIQDLIKSNCSRPRHLLIFINPFGGKKKAPKIYERKIQPLFELAGIDTQVIVTERANHAQDLLQEISLAKIDGIVVVGGDGMFNEILNGLLLRTQKDGGVDFNNAHSQLRQPELRLGIIPAGSTDAVVYSTIGTNDPVSAALHIIIGDSIPVDVCGVYHEQTLLRYCSSMLSYGYFGDAMLDSEQYRWLGPHRYDWAGFKKVLKNRAYEGELLFRAYPSSESSPHDKCKCYTGCKICLDARDQLEKSSQELRQADSWNCLRGKFMGINNATLRCNCGMTPEGMSPAAHLGDGCSDLILIEKCSRLNYFRFLMRIALHHDDPFALDFVKVFRVREFQFRPINLDEANDIPSVTQRRALSPGQRDVRSSVWNCDGEIIEEPAISVKTHCQLIRLFARGIEDDTFDPAAISITELRNGQFKFSSRTTVGEDSLT